MSNARQPELAYSPTKMMLARCLARCIYFIPGTDLGETVQGPVVKAVLQVPGVDRP